MLIIQQANLNDHRQTQMVLDLLNAYAKDPMGGGAGLAGYAQTHLIAELKKRNNVRIFLALVDDQAAGMAVCMEGFSSFAARPLINIHDLVVLAAYRKRGIAQALLAEAEAWAKEINACKLTLEVLEGNHAAQSVYRRFGFAGYELDPVMGRAMFWQKKLDQADNVA